MKKPNPVPLSLLFLFTTVLPAQRDLAAGFGASSLRLDVDAATGSLRSLGVQHLRGEIFVTSARDPSFLGLHFVTAFDPAGNKLRSWYQFGFAQASVWGFRDGATDGTNMVFGYEFGIQCVDADGRQVTTWETQNGTAQLPSSLISGNVLEPKNAGIVRALAYDRAGNGGDGSFWTGNFGSSTFEIDLAGDVIRTYPNAGEISYGFGIDPVSGGTRMWINDRSSGLFGDFGSLVEYDLTTGMFTGRVMENGQLGPSLRGGLDIVPGTIGRGPGASGYDIMHLQQGVPDELLIRRLHLDAAGEGNPPSPATRLGTREPSLLGSASAAPASSHSDLGMRPYTTQTQLLRVGFDLSGSPGDGLGNGGLNGTLAVFFGNIGADAAIGVDAANNILGIRELAHLQPLLTSPMAQSKVFSRGVTLTNDPLLVDANEWRIPLQAGVPLQPIGECLRVQGLWLDFDVAFLPVAMTNQIRFCRDPDGVILSDAFAEFIGSNSFNADTRSGFFSVTNLSNDPIVTLIYSVAVSNPSANTQALLDSSFHWDTDNPGMADVFEGGDSLIPGCTGTYRNGSEVSTGLIFAGTWQQSGTPCDPGSNQGWIGSAPPGSIGGNAFNHISFSFAPGSFVNGAKFEFDADTDGGVGISGADMAGVVVEVRFQSGTVAIGEAIVDQHLPNRAFVQL